jgi:hypothetical protein
MRASAATPPPIDPPRSFLRAVARARLVAVAVAAGACAAALLLALHAGDDHAAPSFAPGDRAFVFDLAQQAGDQRGAAALLRGAHDPQLRSLGPRLSALSAREMSTARELGIVVRPRESGGDLPTAPAGDDRLATLVAHLSANAVVISRLELARGRVTALRSLAGDLRDRSTEILSDLPTR